MKFLEFEIPDERMAQIRAAREKHREAYYAKAREVIGDAGVTALREFMVAYDERVYLLLASLWDGEVGGFYYSRSGRDTDGYLPDIESTVQTMVFIGSSGLVPGHYKDYTPDFMKEKLIKFAKSLQDPEDGYFYHPQWGQNIIVSRRSRDINWATQMLKNFDATPDYPTAYERLAATSDNGAEKSPLPEHLTSIEKFKKYMEQFDAPDHPNKYCVHNNSYRFGNFISSQRDEIKSAGKEYIDYLISWLNERQREDNGAWEPGLGYNPVNGLMKISLVYAPLGLTVPNIEKAIITAISGVTTDENPGWVCCFYNPWITVNMLLGNAAANGSVEISEKLRKTVIDNSADMIRKTGEKVRVFAKCDGGFSYLPNRSVAGSQMAPVAPEELAESDVNSTCIASTGALKNICDTLKIPAIPMFCREDGELFFELIEKKGANRKIHPIPERMKNRSKEKNPMLG